MKASLGASLLLAVLWLPPCYGQGTQVDPTQIGLIGPCGPGENARIVEELLITGKREVQQNLVVDHKWNSGDAVKITGDGAILRFSEIRNSINDGIEVYASDVTIDSCRIHHFLSGTFKAQHDAHGITGCPKRLLIRNCEIFQTSGDCVQFDPDRKDWDEITIENCLMWTGPLTENVAGFKKGEIPGENAFDTKTPASGKRPKVVIRNSIFRGWGHGQIENGTALNIKENVDVTVENCVFFSNEYCTRLRGANKPGFGAHVILRNCFFYDSDCAIRFEDQIEELRMIGCGWGSGLGAHLQDMGGHGKIFVMEGSRSVGPMPVLPNGAPAFGYALKQFLKGGQAPPPSLAALKEAPNQSQQEPQVIVIAFPQIENALKESRYVEALQMIEKERQGANTVARSLLEVLTGRAQRGAFLVKMAACSGERLKGERIPTVLAGMPALAVIRSASENGFEADVAGISVSIPFSDIRPSTLHRLATNVLENIPQNKLALARFLVDIGDSEAAVASLERLRDDPGVGQEARRLLEDL